MIWAHFMYKSKLAENTAQLTYDHALLWRNSLKLAWYLVRFRDELSRSVIRFSFYKMDGETEDYTVSGALLTNAGIKLKQAFGGSGFDDETRLFKDFSSRMYFIESI